MPVRRKALLFALFATTGFSALTLQVVWQRVISMHAGVDLSSFLTVVAAFLAGLGIGTLVGGVLADRLGPRRSLLAYAVSNAGIGIFAWFSIWLFYDVYRSLGANVSGTLPSFLFNFSLLAVPTTLMGLSLPLVARGVVERVEAAAPIVSRLYAVNTMGAGIGAATSGWILLGNLGFVGTVRLAAVLNLVAAVSVFALWRMASGVPAPAAEPSPTTASTEDRPPVAAGRVWPWFVVYGLTGAVALGLEVVFFRIIDALMRSNSYSFGHLLMLYLLVFGAGTAVASRWVGRARRPDRWFLALQLGVGLAALVGLLVLVEGPGLLNIEGPIRRQFAIDGYNVGGYKWWPAGELARMAFVHLLGPLLVMGLPVFLMGASFPFVQALVADRFETLGRRTGLLLFANVVGNVAGTLLVGFVLIDWLGTSGSLRLLAGVLLIPGVACALSLASPSRRTAGAAGAVAIMATLLALFPSNRELWVFFHSAQDRRFALAEDRACVNALRESSGVEDLLFINAASQNGYPYDDYHLLIGLIPALLHPHPARAMAVGLGIGATPYGMSLDPRLDSVDVVELCGGEIELLRGLAEQRSPETRRLLSDERIDIHVGDGRKFLRGADDRFDVMTVDVVRQHAAYSGSLYSVEFYELARSRLRPGGIFAQWNPTTRTLNSATEVFPHVLGFTVASYGGSQFFVASQQPITFDRDVVLGRFDALVRESAGRFVLSGERLESIRRFLATTEPVRLQTDGPAGPVPADALNRDLFPRDEYFLNNPSVVESRPKPTP